MKNVEDIYPLTPMQKGMLFHTACAPESGIYLTQLMGTVEGERSITALEAAWNQVIRRHSILRTSFVWEGMDEPVQVVHRHASLPTERYDWRGLSEHEREQRLSVFLDEDRQRGCELSEAPLMRLSVFELDNQQYRFVWTHHHLLLDGWSLPLVLKELFACAEAAMDGTEVCLPAPRPYREYISWLLTQDESRAETFWRKMLAGFTEPTILELGTEGVGLQGSQRGHREVRRSLSSPITTELAALARKNQLTLNTIVQGAWTALLSRYSSSKDVVFGGTVSGRPPALPGVESMVGLFINTLPMRFQLDPGAPLLSWLKQIQMEQTKSRDYEHCSLTAIQGYSQVPRNLPLFESILIFENYPSGTSFQKTSGRLSLNDIRVAETTNYPLALIVSPGQELEIKLNYHCSRFSEAQIQRMLGHLANLLRGVAINPDCRLSQLPLLSASEREQQLVVWNQTGIAFPSESCAHELFETQAARTPAASALVFGDHVISYDELNRRANQLAHRLRRLGVGPEVLTAVAVERGPQMIVAILAILKAGGAYLPLALENPAERLAFLLQDAGPQVIVTEHHLQSRWTGFPGQVLSLDDEADALAQESTANPVNTATAGNLAYIIYTSGSTGRPKGVLLEHRGLCNLAAAQRKLFAVEPGDRVLQFASLSFDASVSEVFVTLLSGATLCLASREALMPGPDLLRFLMDQRITVATLPPSVLAALLDHPLPRLRTLVSAGEACAPELVARWAPGRRFLNAYGPTEATVCATAAECHSTHERPPIGLPIDNTRIYLVDAEGQPVPVGVPGEIWIGGVGVARGYLNRPELTAERFFTDPFTAQGRVYKTGDRARFRSDGTLEYLGRFDHQVKLRGFRIELGEVEAVLRRHASVRDAVVVDREDGGRPRRLVAYLVAWEGAGEATAELRRHLSEKLPDYMVPAAFVWLDQLPLNPHGKIDRGALPPPLLNESSHQRSNESPRSPLEEVLAGYWAEILGLQSVGIHENFFELGGHSLLATQLISRLRDSFGVSVPFSALFDNPTVAEMAKAMLRKQSTRRLIEKTAELLIRTAGMSEEELEALAQA